MGGDNADDCTRDTFFRGKLTVLQPRRGYRFSLDAPMLAGFLPPQPQTDALEVGTGSGIISLMGLALGRFRSVQAVEVQSRLCGLASRNARLNGFADRMRVICGDFLNLKHRLCNQSLVFANPPYYPLGRGRLSALAEVRDARFETRMTLEAFLGALQVVLAPQGKACLILPVEREAEFMGLAGENALFPRRMRYVHSHAHDKAGRFLVQLQRRRGDVELQPPLVVFRAAGEYTPEMEALLSGRDHDK